MALSLFEMMLDRLAQFVRLRLLRHLGQRFHELLFGMVDVLQLVHKKIVH